MAMVYVNQHVLALILAPSPASPRTQIWQQAAIGEGGAEAVQRQPPAMSNNPLNDIGARMVAGAAVAFVAASAIVLPGGRGKDAAALELFDRRYKELSTQDKKVAEFAAGHKRWTGFFEHTIYPITRRLPGAKNPIVNP
jgi:hypothetical protein